MAATSARPYERPKQMTEPLWRPSPSAVRQSAMAQFTEYVAAAASKHFPTYDALHQWSISEPGVLGERRHEGPPNQAI